MNRVTTRMVAATAMVATVLALTLGGCQARADRKASPTAAEAAALQAQEARILAQTGTITQTRPKTVAEQVAGRAGAMSLRITSGGFAPAELRVSKDSRVKLHIKNDDSKAHNLVIERFHVATGPLEPGAESFVEFTAGQSGTWPFWSDLPGAPERGFQGALVVE